MNKFIIIVVVLLGGAGYWVLNKDTVSKPEITNTTNTSPTPEVLGTKTTDLPVSKPTTPLAPSPKATPPAPTPAAPVPSAQKPTTHSVAIQNFSFSQTSLTVKKGDTVVWTNKDSAPHTVTGNNGGPTSSTMNKNGTYSFTFNNVGTFDYICAFHPSMKGVVVVQ